MQVVVRGSLDGIESSWDAVAPTERVALESPHLRAIQAASVNDLQPHYLLAREAGRTAGIAYCFLMEMDLAFLEKNLPPAVVSTIRCWYPRFLNLRILECGLVSGLGRAIAAANGNQRPFAEAAVLEMERIGREERADFLLVRDVPMRELPDFCGLEQLGFVPLMGYPLAMLALPWDSFEGYLGALKAQTRKRLRAFLARETQGYEVEVLPRFAEHAERLARLWRNTHERVDTYSHEVLEAPYFVELDRHLPERSHVVAIRKDGEIVAFSAVLQGDSEYFSAHAGFDYPHCEGSNVYQLLTLSVIAEAIRRGCRAINLGITTYDKKFELGCEAEPVVYFVKHLAQPRLSLALARSFQEAIEPPQNNHRVFHDQDVSTRPDLPQLARTLAGSRRPDPRDAFAKIWAYDRVNKFRLAGLYSFYPPFESAQCPLLQFEGREVVMLGSNAYLGLSTHPEVVAAARSALEKYGTGCSGSPLMNGTLDIHVDLAQALARFMQKDDALLFSTGYQTNLGVVSALLGKDDVAIMDRLDHASLIDGSRLSRVEVARFQHSDLSSLEEALERHADRGKLVVVDSVFSMEGTVADLREIVRLARRYGARVMVDEAHAIGVLGPGGRGACELQGVLQDVDVVMGTFSKSFASVGGFVAASAPVIDYLRHTARSHIFSASLPPASVATVRKALDIIVAEPQRRTKLLANAAYAAARLRELGYDAEYRGTAIVPVHVGHELLTYALFSQLLREGVFVNPVASPAVAVGHEMLRTSYMATHDVGTIERAMQAFARVRTATFPRAWAAPCRPAASATAPASLACSSAPSAAP